MRWQCAQSIGTCAGAALSHAEEFLSGDAAVGVTVRCKWVAIYCMFMGFLVFVEDVRL
jgi:hypothetical protein